MLTALRYIPQIRTVFVAAALLILAGSSWAVIPRNLNFHGRLLDASGIPITGNNNLTFRIFTEEAGVSFAVWIENQPAIAFETNGVFNAILGSTTPIAPTLFNADQLWLEPTINTNPLVTYTRQRLVTVPYAFRTATAETVVDGAITTAKLVNNSVALAKLNTTEVDARYINVTGDTMTGTLTLAANSLIVGTNQLVLSNGRVGIGTAEPQSKLDVEGDISGGGMLIACAAASAEGELESFTSYIADTSGDANWIPLVKMPVLIPPGTSSLRGGMRFKGYYTQEPIDVGFGIDSILPENFATTYEFMGDPQAYALSGELIIPNVQSGWHELVVYGRHHHANPGGAGIGYINSFTVYSMN